MQSPAETIDTDGIFLPAHLPLQDPPRHRINVGWGIPLQYAGVVSEFPTVQFDMLKVEGLGIAAQLGIRMAGSLGAFIWCSLGTGAPSSP